jgi:hypothetical protein
MLDAGICVTINSDDPAYFGGYLNENYLQTFAALGLNPQQAKTVAANSLQASFAKDADKALQELTDSGKLSVDQLLKVTEQANNFKIKMEEIASDERIKTIEAKITLDVARLEAETQQVEAAFDSITATIENTGDVLKALYGEFTGAGTYEQLKLEQWINEENARRDKAFEMQEKLIQVQIDAIKARTDAMNRGDAFIRVDGSGLEPHLEAFMWEVLKAIQVQASADMQEFLLGVATA